MKCVCPMGGDRTCPDDCLYRTWTLLTAAEKRTQRKSFVTRLAKQGYTQDRIALQLGVSQSTISRDFEFIEIDKSKAAKTSTNPKGAGRPKGSKKKTTSPPKPHSAHDAIVAAASEGKSQKEIAADLGVNQRVVRRELESDAIARAAKAEPEIDPKTLSLTVQQKLDIAIRQHKRKLDLEYETRCRKEVHRWLNEVSLPQYAKELAELERSITSRKGIMDRVTYKKILTCLHVERLIQLLGIPLSQLDPNLARRYDEAFRLFTELEKRVLDEKESPTEFRKILRTVEEH